MSSVSYCSAEQSICATCITPIPVSSHEHLRSGDLDSLDCLVYTPCCDKTLHGRCFETKIVDQHILRSLYGGMEPKQILCRCLSVPCPMMCGYLADSMMACEALHMQPTCSAFDQVSDHAGEGVESHDMDIVDDTYGVSMDGETGFQMFDMDIDRDSLAGRDSDEGSCDAVAESYSEGMSDTSTSFLSTSLVDLWLEHRDASN